MAFPLAVETLFPQIAVPAFKENREKPEFVFFAQSHRSENEESRIETTRPEQIRVALSTPNGFGVNPERSGENRKTARQWNHFRTRLGTAKNNRRIQANGSV